MADMIQNPEQNPTETRKNRPNPRCLNGYDEYKAKRRHGLTSDNGHAGGMGGCAPDGTDLARPRMRTVLLKSVRWATTPELRQRILEELITCLARPGLSPREKNSIVLSLLKIEQQNQADDHLLATHDRIDRGQATEAIAHLQAPSDISDPEVLRRAIELERLIRARRDGVNPLPVSDNGD